MDRIVEEITHIEKEIADLRIRRTLLQNRLKVQNWWASFRSGWFVPMLDTPTVREQWEHLLNDSGVLYQKESVPLLLVKTKIGCPGCLFSCSLTDITDYQCDNPDEYERAGFDIGELCSEWGDTEEESERSSIVFLDQRNVKYPIFRTTASTPEETFRARWFICDTYKPVKEIETISYNEERIYLRSYHLYSLEAYRIGCSPAITDGTIRALNFLNLLEGEVSIERDGYERF